MFDLAAEKSGFENVWNCEIDPFCRKVLKKNFPGTKQYEDVTKLFNPEPVDIISGGFPCQDISNAKTWTTNGTFPGNGINGARSGLWFEYLRIIGETRPKFIVAENVAALTKQGLKEVVHSLSDIGYFSEWAIISAAQFGAPHLRKRIWIVAYPERYGRKQESIILSQVLGKKIRQAPEWEFSRTICEDNGKKTLPESFGIHDGMPSPVDNAERIKALGNGLIWQIPYEIFKAIQEYENKN